MKKKKDVLHAFRVNGFKYRYTQSNDCDALCCLTRPTGKGSWQGCAAVAKVRRDAASAGMWFVEVTTPDCDDCAHRTMGIRRGVWSQEAGRNLIEQQYFEYRQSPNEIAYKLQNEKKVCHQMSNTRLQEKIRTFLQGWRRKRYGHGMNMTYQEFCAILDAWPMGSQLPDEVIFFITSLTLSWPLFLVRTVSWKLLD